MRNENTSAMSTVSGTGRRQFLKTTALLGGVMAATPCRFRRISQPAIPASLRLHLHDLLAVQHRL